MKILILSKKFPYPLKDGEAIAIFNNIKGFSRLGHKVTVLAINTLKHHYDIKRLPEEIRILADFREVTLDTSPTYKGALLNLIEGLPYHVERFISEEFRLKLIKVLMEKTYDLVQCEGLFLGPYLDTVHEWTPAPVVMRAHNVESQIWQRVAANEKNPLKRRYLELQAERLRKYEVLQLNRYDALVPITDEDHKKLEAMGAMVPMHTSPAGIDLERFNGYDGNTTKNTLFFIGGLDWLPNQEGIKWFLDKVWPQAKKKYPTLEFHIAGRNTPSWLKGLKVEGVKVYGEVEDALEFMAHRQVMVAPLFSGSGMRIKIVEGMAMSKPVIATTIAAEGIYYDNNKNILIADTVEEYLKRIGECIEQPATAESLGKNARQLMENKYDNRKFAEALIEFYNSRFGADWHRLNADGSYWELSEDD